jgi:hypothetical protein
VRTQPGTTSAADRTMTVASVGRHNPPTRAQQTFKERDLKRALKAAVSLGLAIVRFEIDRHGKIIVVAGGSPAPDGTSDSSNPWDKVL